MMTVRHVIFGTFALVVAPAAPYRVPNLFPLEFGAPVVRVEH